MPPPEVAMVDAVRADTIRTTRLLVAAVVCLLVSVAMGIVVMTKQKDESVAAIETRAAILNSISRIEAKLDRCVP